MKTRIEDPHYDSASHDDLAWNDRYEAVSSFVQEKFATLTTEETCKILQDWISIHYGRHDNWRYIEWCLKEAFDEFQAYKECFGPDAVAQYLRATAKPFIQTKPDPKLLCAVIEAILHPREPEEEE